jgi:hypothetical protein
VESGQICGKNFLVNKKMFLNFLLKRRRKKMTPEELQVNFIAAIWYYCGVTQSDSNRYFTENPGDLSPSIGTINVDGNGDFYVDTWALGYAQPDNTTLAEPPLSSVNNFAKHAYIHPQEIIETQCFEQLSDSDLSVIEKSQLTEGMLIFNTTSHKLQYLSGGTWTDLW